MRVALLVAFAGCGRIDFAPHPCLPCSNDAGSDDLVAYYRMDADSTSTTLVDASGHHLDGTCNADPCGSPASGIIDGALSFTGTNAYLVPDAPLLHLDAGFTVALWIEGDGTVGTPLAKVQADGPGASFELYFDTGDIQFCTDDDPGPGGETCMSSGVAPPTTWQHVAMTWDGATKVLYLDGVAIATATPFTTVFDTSPLVVGTDGEDGSVAGGIGALMDELRVYDRALSPAEIVTLRDLR